MCAACVGLTSNMQLYAASDSRSADSDDLLQMSVQERDVIGHGLLYDTVLASIYTRLVGQRSVKLRCDSARGWSNKGTQGQRPQSR